MFGNEKDLFGTLKADELLVISVKLISMVFAIGTLFVANLASLQLLILRARDMQNISEQCYH